MGAPSFSDTRSVPSGVRAPERPVLRVALVCCPDLPFGGADRHALTEACRERHIELTPVVWSRADVNWTQFDALLCLYVKDYSFRLSSFRAWLAERQRQGAVLLNDAELLRYGMDKGYLIDLRDEGLDMITTVLRPAHARTPGPFAANATVVVKPRLGGGGRGLQLHSVAEWRPPSEDVLVQLYEPTVAERGELSVICVEGQPLGCVRRSAADGEFRVQEEYGGQACAEPLEEPAERAARKVLSLLPSQPLYCRVDLWDRPDGRWLLAGAELLQPDLHLRLLDGSADVLAAALRRRLAGSVITD